MAKVNGLQGVISGKLGNTVFRNRYGKTIAAQYQPNVENRRTDTQVAQREKFKMMNQIAALMAPAIAIPRNGGQTARNQFVQDNIKLIESVPNSVEKRFNALDMQLTRGTTNLTSFTASFVDASNKSSVQITARGGTFTVGYGTLAVSTRPERRLMVTGLAVPKNSSDVVKLVFGGVATIANERPNDDIANYEDIITLSSFGYLADEEYEFVFYAYEIAIPQNQINRSYGNTGGAATAQDPWIVIRSAASNGFSDAMLSKTYAVLPS